MALSSYLPSPLRRDTAVTIQSGLCLEELIEMTSLDIDANGQNYRDHADNAGKNLLVSYLKNQSKVRGVFYQGNGSDPQEGNIDHNLADFQKFAVAYTCHALNRCDRYDFNQAANMGNANSFTDSVYNSSNWTKLSYQLYTLKYPDVVRGKKNNSFRQYLDDNPKDWGKKLSDIITSGPWLNDMINRIINNQWPLHNRRLSVLVSMVDQLDSSLTTHTINTINNAYKQFNVADFRNRQWGNLDTGSVVGDVNRAIDKVNTYRILQPPSGDPNPYRKTVIKTVYGEAVENWLKSTSNRYDFYVSGKLQNIHQKIEGGGCTVL